MTSENTAEPETAEPTKAASAKAADDRLIDELVSGAQGWGLQPTGEGEITDHLGYSKHEAVGENGGNSHNGKRCKTVLTDAGPVEISVPRDRDGSFEPKIVEKRQKRLSGVDETAVWLSAKEPTTGEVQAHLAGVYGAEVSGRTLSAITDKVLEGMAEWQNRPLDAVYPAVFIDAVHVRIRNGAVADHPARVALAVTVEGRCEILGLWAGDGGEGAKHWLRILTEVKNRGMGDVLMLVCDGLRGCRRRLRHSGRRRSCRLAWCTCCGNLSAMPPARTGTSSPRVLKPVHTALTEEAALERFAEFVNAWGAGSIRRSCGWGRMPGRGAPGRSRGRVHLLPAIRCRDPPHRLHH